MKILILTVFILVVLFPFGLKGQENYEIQVYPSEIIGKGATMVELHSNFTSQGRPMKDEVRPTQHAFHETVEITHGFTSFFEIGFYQFFNLQQVYGFQYVGSHLRPRLTIPESWNWPLGLSLSSEIGYQRREYSSDTWSLEIRPIIDKNFKWVYLSFNPTFAKTLKGLNQNETFDFEPNFKIAFHLNSRVDFGAEYYGATGPLFQSPSVPNQEHAIYAALDLDLHPDWEFNFGTGWGLTDSTDGLVIKLILGHKFGAKNVTKKMD
jgi:hypothetical protein